LLYIRSILAKTCQIGYGFWLFSTDLIISFKKLIMATKKKTAKTARKTAKKTAKKSVASKSRSRKVAAKKSSPRKKAAKKKAAPKKAARKTNRSTGTTRSSRSTSKTASKKATGSGSLTKRKTKQPARKTAKKPAVAGSDQLQTPSTQNQGQQKIDINQYKSVIPAELKPSSKFIRPGQNLKFSTKPKGGPKPSGKKPLWN
jgi:hypothetical protein